MTAATGLNTSLIEDVKMRRCAVELTSALDESDTKALSSPSFAVTQALVALLAQNAACFSALNRISSASPSAHKCNTLFHTYIVFLFVIIYFSYYLRQGGYVFARLCLSVCLS